MSEIKITSGVTVMSTFPPLEFFVALMLFFTPVHPACNVNTIVEEYRPRWYDLQREHGSDLRTALGYLLGDLFYELRTCEPFTPEDRPGV